MLAAQAKGDETGFRYRMSYLQLRDLRQQSEPFTDVFAFGIDQGGMSVAGRPYPFIYDFVTGNFFSALGVTPALGRLFQPGEGENPQAEQSLVLGYNFWLRHLGGRPNIIGQEIRLNGESARIIGVAPADFHGAYEGLDPEGYMPLSAIHYPGWFTDRARRPLTVLARLREGTSIREAQSSMDVLSAASSSSTRIPIRASPFASCPK